MTELSFLVDLLLNHKLPKATRDLVASRIKEVEEALPKHQFNTVQNPNHVFNVTVPQNNTGQGTLSGTVKVGGVVQSASMAKAIAEMEAEKALKQGLPSPPPIEEPTQPPIAMAPPVPQPTVIAHTPAAMGALQSRNQAIDIALSGKEEKGRTSPRKW